MYNKTGPLICLKFCLSVMFPKDKYGSDLEHLAFMASYITKEISTELSDDVMFTHNAIWDKVGGRQLRRIYPRGACEVIRNTSSPTRLYFVGFFGDSAEYDDTIRTKLWSLDDALSSELKNQLHIIAYVSSEVVPNGNWCNLVVLTSPEGVEQWRNVASHEDAV